MRKLTLSLLIVLLTALLLLLVSSVRSDSASPVVVPTDPAPIVCTVTSVTGAVAHISCAQEGVALPPGQQPSTVPLNPIISYVPTKIPVPGPTKTIRVPQPRATVTVPPLTVPTRTRTITVPGPTQTEFIRQPQRTIRPPARTVTLPPVIETETITVPGPTQTVTRQPQPSRDTIITKERPTPFGMPITDTVIERVGLGLFALLGLIGLILLGLWLGYAMGYRDRDRSEAQFLQALRQQIAGRGLHE